jgi:hypothetical protein
MAHNTRDETKNHARFKKTVTVDGATAANGGVTTTTLTATTSVTAPMIASGTASRPGLQYTSDSEMAAGFTASVQPVTFVSLMSGPGTCSVDDGTVSGQTKMFVDAAGASALLVVPANATGYTNITLNGAGSGFSLLWTGSGWVITGRFSGDAAAAGAVAGLPVVV